MGIDQFKSTSVYPSSEKDGKTHQKIKKENRSAKLSIHF
jgi:hypothetical protein